MVHKSLYNVMRQTSYTEDQVIEYLQNTKKPISHTHGIGYRKPTINKVAVDKEEAVRIFKTHSRLCDVDEYDDYIHINTFSSSDMW